MKLQDYELDYIEKWLPEASVKYKDGSQAVNLGIIITVFFKDGHLPEVRRKMVECVDRFYDQFKPYLKKTLATKWVSITEKNYQKKRQKIIELSSEEIFSWYLGGEETDYHSPDYEILIMGKRIFNNEDNRSVIKLCFPFSLLKESGGKQRYESWIKWLCDTFNVESGYAGLSFILPYAFERMFPYEYALSQRFPGVIVDSLGTLEGGAAVLGLKGACWYTIIGNPWLNELGGQQRVEHRLSNTPEIKVLPYSNGIILKAGELPPALGEVKTEELPPLLVKVNQIVKPVRLNITRSLHFYSEYENLQFEEESTKKWYERFDEASALLDDEKDNSSSELVRITVWSDQVAIHSGQWAATVDGTTQYIQILQGQRLPEFEDIYGVKHHACWSLLKRDDNGSVFLLSE